MTGLASIDASVCEHHEHTSDDPASYLWECTDRNGIPLGAYCAEHLGDALDDFDGDVHLRRCAPGNA